MTRSMTRSAMLLAASVVLTSGLLSGCSAGQVTQTEAIEAPVPGINVDSADGTIHMRNVAIVYKDPQGYPQGGTAQLRVWIFNSSHQPVKLVGVTSEAGPVALVSATAGASSTAPSLPETPGASGSASPPPSPSGSASPPPSPSGSASPPPSPSGSAPAGAGQISVDIPTDGFAVLSPQYARVLQITGLTRPIKPIDMVEMTFRFDNGATITARVPMDTPMSPLPRSPLEFTANEH